jgi:hypothetical protein
MQIPFVIDNQQHKMAEVLSSILAQHQGKSLDIATAYFNVGGWQLPRDGLKGKLAQHEEIKVVEGRGV